MKLTLILICSLLVVGALAGRFNKDRSRRHSRRRCREEDVNDNSIQFAGEAHDSDADVESLPEDVEPKDSKCKHRRRHWGHRRGGHGSRGGENSEHFEHDPDWHKQHNVPMPEDDSNSNINHRHRHHHRPHHHHRHHPHHHHHHHNRTTTTTPATTTTTNLPEDDNTWSSIDTEK